MLVNTYGLSRMSTYAYAYALKDAPVPLVENLILCCYFNLFGSVRLIRPKSDKPSPLHEMESFTILLYKCIMCSLLY